MTDYTELKRLAEAFPSDLDWDSNTEPFFNGPSGESLGGGATGFYAVYGKPFHIEGDDYEYEGQTYVESCTADFAKFMISARDGVLALIAENERLLGKLSSTMGVGGGNGSLFVHGDYDSIKAAQAIVLERDQLKAEVEKFRKDAQDASAGQLHLLCQRDLLKIEVEALRKALTDCSDSLHAEMLQKFGGQLPDDMHPVTRREYDRDMAEVAGYRAAMSKEAGHD